MSLGLHYECQERLIEKIADQLPHLKVKNRIFLDLISTGVMKHAESVLPGSGPIKGCIEKFIGETPIESFILETLARELTENQNYDSEASPMSLIEIEGYRDTKTVARRLVDDFESLPWDYSSVIKLDNDFGKLFSKTLKEYNLCDSIKLITPNEDFAKEFPCPFESEVKEQSSLMAILSPPPTPTWDFASTYLQIKMAGFIGQIFGSSTLEEAISKLKAFCGLGIALRLFSVNYIYRPAPFKAMLGIHRRIAGDWYIEREQNLDSSFSDIFSELVLHDLYGELDSEIKKVDWIRTTLDQIRCTFENEDKGQKIILASQWLFDSYGGKNDLLSFVQAAVVMEILLGEKTISDITGLGELLRNRCAYLIGKSHSERERILNDFKIIYDVRSMIVHRGKSRLNKHERSLFFKLQWMCRRVIFEEVKLLQQDTNKNA